MTSHPNRNWRSRWAVGGQEARHLTTGLIVRFERAQGAGAWDGQATNAQEVLQALQAAGSPDIARTLARLMREAGEIFAERQHDR